MLCLIIIGADECVRRYYLPPVMDLSDLKDSIDAFYAEGRRADSLAKIALEAKTVEPQVYASVDVKRSNNETKTVEKDLHIEINSATKEELLEIKGVGPFYADQIIALRAKYGGFTDLSTLKELYGMDNERLSLWTKALYVDADKVYAKIGLNSADSVALCQIPSVKGYDAQRIINYRKRLGGFYSSTQLLEVYGISNEDYELIMLRAMLDSLVIKKMDINNMPFKDMMRHPYIDGYENTKAIFRYLDLCAIESWSDFCKIPNLKIENLEGLKHYVDFKPFDKDHEK